MTYARRGYGTGRGAGYKNLAPSDSYIHSLNRKGVGTYVKRVSTPIRKSKTPHLDMMKDRTDIFSLMVGNPLRKDFGSVSTPVKKSILGKMFDKAKKGVEYAVEWEKEHLPAQEKWVQDHWQTLKDEAKEFQQKQKDAERQKRIEEHKKEQEDRAQEDVMAIKKNAEKISETLGKPEEPVYTNMPLEEPMMPSLDEQMPEAPEPEPIVEIQPPKPNIMEEHLKAEEEAQKTREKVRETLDAVEGMAKKGFAKTKDFIEKEYAIGKKYIQEQQEKAKELHEMSDAELTKLAIQTPKPLFSKNNKYESELFRRETVKNYIANQLHLIDMIETARYNAMRPIVTSRGVYPSKNQFNTRTSSNIGSDMGGFDKFFGFVDPFMVFRTGFKIK
jgi:hypothetical protein